VKVCHRSASDTRQGSLCRFVLGRKHEHNHAFSLPRVTSFMRRAWGQRFARGRCSQLGPKDRFDSGGQSVSMLDVVCSGAKVAPPHSLRLAAQAHMAGKAHGMGVDIAWHMLRNLHAPMPANLPFYPPFAMWPCKTLQSVKYCSRHCCRSKVPYNLRVHRLRVFVDSEPASKAPPHQLEGGRLLGMLPEQVVMLDWCSAAS
jgi:hypothetical protein